ncbi:MAG: rod shape-determining protein MreC [Bacteroidales bacterium]|nr:rod shape-determining protein MreC [Bacteroidales bacterium]
MQRKKSIGSTITAATVFILLEVVSLSMLSSNATLQGMWFARATHNINASIWGGIENIGRYFSLRKENDRLAGENFELRSRLAELEENTLITGITRDTIGSFCFQSASIVRHSRSGQHDYFLIDKGELDGIKAGYGAITDRGTVGIVDATTAHYSYVMSFTNADCVVSARLGKGGSVGSLIWDGRHSNGGILQAIPCHVEIAPGDTVYTSGYSSIYPADIPLGITGKAKTVNGAFYEIKVELFEDYSKTRYVTIVGNIHEDEIAELSGLK